MTTAVLTRAVRARTVGIVVAAISIGALLVLGMAAYAEVDLDVYRNLPEAMRSVMGIPADADAASLAYNVMLGTMAALTLAGLAVSIGASAIAGEERDGTLGLLLANPASRVGVLTAKAGALVVLIGAGGLALWGAGLLAPAILGVEVGSAHVGALVLHVTATALFHGFLALAIGSWTGRRALASAVGAAVVTLGFLLVGLLPLLESTEPLVNLVPWYYLDGSQPLLDGVDLGDLAVLLGGTAVFLAVSVVGVRRRDLRARQLDRGLVDRLRAHPRTQQVVDRLAGAARVSRIATWTASQHQGLLLVVTLLMVAMSVMMGPMYAAIEGDLAQLAASLPEELMAFAGGGDMSTPEGFFQVEILGLVAPIAVILVGTAIAARALAGEEQRGTMGLLLANPVSRSRVVAEKALTMVVFVGLVGVATFVGIAGGSLLGGLGIDLGDIAATSTLLVLLGLVFSALALAIGAATGRSALAVYGTAGAAVVLHVVNSFLSINPSMAPWARISPFHWYGASEPLRNGMPWGHAAVLLATAAVLVAAAFPLFVRRDLHQR